jgi:hypothetical protein
VASIFNTHCEMNTWSSYANICKGGVDRVTHWMKEVERILDNRFDDFVCASKVPFSNIGVGRLQPYVTKESPNVYSPIHLATQAIFLKYKVDPTKY